MPDRRRHLRPVGDRGVLGVDDIGDLKAFAYIDDESLALLQRLLAGSLSVLLFTLNGLLAGVGTPLSELPSAAEEAQDTLGVTTCPSTLLRRLAGWRSFIVMKEPSGCLTTRTPGG